MSRVSFGLHSASGRQKTRVSSELVPPGLPRDEWVILAGSSASFIQERDKGTSASTGSLGGARLPSVANVPTSKPVSPEPGATIPSMVATAMFRQHMESGSLL